MAVFELLSTLLTGFLIGYLTLSNMVMGEVTQLKDWVSGNTNTYTEETTESYSTLTEIETPTKKFGFSLPRVLLDHAEYQRAAVASFGQEESVVHDPVLPISETVANALVNIYCQYKTDSYIKTTTGTGFFISSKGVILTNAHVAQFLLLEESGKQNIDVQCVIREGNPAKAKYEAELLYISPTWILENASLITSDEPRGTGERDYALLYVSKSLDGSPLPSLFPAISIDVDLLSRRITGESVLSAGYPAELLFKNGSDADLVPVVASTTIGTLYTFGSNYADIFSVSESAVGEQGASGGPIVHVPDRSVIGLIVTKGDANTEGSHSLRALTLSYINRTIIEETGFSLHQNIQGDIAYRGDVFKEAMVPFLTEMLVDELSNE